MAKTKPPMRVITKLLAFTIFFLVTYSNYSQGPNAPEAASFEPVDATDMVNLVTGDLSYVLPLLNVPSPEGGYPLAISYHAGIAMDQEASWVGLGWTLNPGVINRSINGYPDDWGEGRSSELYFDKGGTDNYYSFSIGGTLPNGLTIGVSKSWGAYRAWGGIVGYGGVNFSFGSEGYGMGVGIGGISYNMSDAHGTSIGISYMPSGVNSDTGKPYNPNGFGGGIGYNLNSGEISGGFTYKKTGLGISFSSTNGISGTVNGAGMINQKSSVSQGDYYIKTTSKGFSIDAGIFWVSYRHRKYQYSLFKNTNFFISGILNAYQTKKVENNIQEMHHAMDVKEFYLDTNDSSTHIQDSFLSREPSASTFMAPNYDNYIVSAQGLSGSIAPRVYDDILLYNNGFNEKLVDQEDSHTSNYDIRYLQLSPNVVDANYKLNSKIHFYFNKTNSSFLRVQNGDWDGPFQSNGNIEFVDLGLGDESIALSEYAPEYDASFSSSNTPTGDQKMNNNRKRDGNFIETFTNKDILDSNTNGWFLETQSSGFYRNYYLNPEEGIGAYRITTTDGKTYHYSLPVYHFESVYKNYSQEDENDIFFESKKLSPYATHWLLTAITGPDYVDFNNNNKVDKEDYGYWIEFDYGKWSDGYGWRSPKAGTKIVDENKTYFWGRKQIYYLDQIKTRTHTALFIKSLREDNLSARLKYNKNEHNFTESFSHLIADSEEFSDKKETKVEKGVYYKGDNEAYTVTSQISVYGNKSSWKYIDIPINKSLKLDKIILLKNDDVDFDKNNSEPIYGQNRIIGHSVIAEGYKSVYLSSINPSIRLFYDYPFINSFVVNQDNNILDIHDINSANLIEKSIKTINFTYDYSLSNNLPNSSSGHLTLKKLYFTGKSGNYLMPPYKYSYINPGESYNNNNQDVWGYVKNKPDAWSLYEIQTPTGGKVKIEYEPDSFYAEAAYRDHNAEGDSYFYMNNSYAKCKNPEEEDLSNITNIAKSGEYLYIYFDTSKADYDLNQIMNVNDVIEVKISILEYIDNIAKGRSLDNYYTVAEINQNNYLKLITNELTNLERHESISVDDCECFTNEYGNYTTDVIPDNLNKCLREITFRMRHGIFTTNDENGKKGGGIRVKSIEITDGANSYKTQYDYRNPLTNLISGITSYEPFDSDKGVAYIQELPAPNVMYNFVKVSSYGNNKLDTYNLYEFEVLSPYNFSQNLDYNYNLGDHFKVKFNQRKSFDIGRRITELLNERFHKNTIYDYTSRLGNLLSLRFYNNKNQLLKLTSNSYKTFDNDSQENGVSQETFKYIKRVGKYKQYIDPNNGAYEFREEPFFNFGSSSKVEFPNVLESINSQQGGHNKSVFFNKHDFLTGKVVETTSLDSKGDEIKTEIIPAYKRYPDMGSKVDNPNNKNMLTQEAASYTSVYHDNQWKITGVGIQTWKDWGNDIWRKHKSFAWDGSIDSDGFYTSYTKSVTNDDGFNWSSTTVEDHGEWKFLSETSKYNNFSAPLEVVDLNKSKASTKYDSKHEKILVTSNAPYNAMFYSGAEDNLVSGNFGGNVNKGSGSSLSNVAHTGKNSLQISSGQQAFKVVPGTTDDYKISVWVHGNSYTNIRINNNGTDVIYNNDEVVKAGDWVQLNFYTEVNAATPIYVKTTDGKIRVDDFRMHPVSSSMTSYVYNEWDELECIIGANNMAAKYKYDETGRLKSVYQEIQDTPALTGGFKKVAEHNYNYKIGQ